MSLDPDGFPVEADRLADELGLDFSVESVDRVQGWLAGNRSDGSAVAAGCYVGEVLRRRFGGRWSPDGTLEGVGAVMETSPLAKARAGEDLVGYVGDVARYAE